MKHLLSESLSTYSRLVSNSGLNLVSLEISNSNSSRELTLKHRMIPNLMKSLLFGLIPFSVTYAPILDF